ncbi:TIGR01457 family HAD-type hydrolase [Lentilactobacillus buchneri]|uniref:Acid sugar phosphatase n=2 Tax=Lentilactobacillus buchneri TaxID=1581 RepID=J9W147_LENBU|nr:TIGR01457 family HAD-type hydrolase [Lentilactobacillus buchneri]MCC6100404.1 TIGR01457 family HAD-type hydrolase [Lactobacillus sp.]AEB73216.1 HAD-superfamily subfamily IIA hydrolase like protein [Lentilactobacillus buchneri NRRL B-30929]AFS00134.1 HAD family sugar phosphatase [Lentilactobacillus buchneri subsp. silagei CD034]KRK67846.1 HAD-superfamily hydrolase [Lentilactobacillus buchneri DSM 20057]MCT2882588.1 TIGR01457 family HAD-type hydrolase [Lentilactobacillus buchneri]
MTNYKGYFIDLDGTVYAGKKRIPAAKRFIERLQKANIPFLFVTNNSTQLPRDVVKNLADNHDIHVKPENVYTSGMATVDYMNEHRSGDASSVYIVGEMGLKQVILANDYRLEADHPDYVVVGLDSDLTYEKLSEAVLAIRSGSTFIGTNPDTNIPKERGMMPGAGSVVKFVEYATQVEPIMIGKPKARIIESAIKKIGLEQSDVVMVGDNYNTDIKAGINAGVDTLLVYTGLSTKQQVAKESVQPTHQIDSLDDWRL